MRCAIVLGVSDELLRGDAERIIAADDRFRIAGHCADPKDVAACMSDDIDVLVVDWEPTAAHLESLKALSTSFVYAVPILIADASSKEVLKSAMAAGARFVVDHPVTGGALLDALDNASHISRERRSAAGGAPRGTGTVVAVAGSKGGVGTTTISVQLALAAARSEPREDVCLVDLDMEGGRVRTLYGAPEWRNNVAMVQLESTWKQIAGFLFPHPGQTRLPLRVLFAPEGPDVVAPETVGLLLKILKEQFAVVVVDVGRGTTEAAMAVVDMADRTLLVVTPDRLSIDAASRLIEFWAPHEHVGTARISVEEAVQPASISILVNRAGPKPHFGPDDIKATLPARLIDASVPAGYRDLADAMLMGDPELVVEGSLVRAYAEIAGEIKIALPPPPRRNWSRFLGGQRGSIAVETVGLAGTILLVLLAVWEIVLSGFTFVLAGHSAREAARELAVGGAVSAVAQDAVPGAWRPGMSVREGPDFVEVTLNVPLIVPGFDGPLSVTARAGTVVEQPTEGTP